MPPIAVGRVENQNEPKRSPPCGCLGSFWFSTRFAREKVIRLAQKTVYRGLKLLTSAGDAKIRGGSVPLYMTVERTVSNIKITYFSRFFSATPEEGLL